MKFSIFLVLVALTLTGCTKTPSKAGGDPDRLLPPSAKVVKELGNNWVVVEIEGKNFLYRPRNIDKQAGSEVFAPLN
jgi:hypothetical protein